MDWWGPPLTSSAATDGLLDHGGPPVTYAAAPAADQQSYSQQQQQYVNYAAPPPPPPPDQHHHQQVQYHHHDNTINSYNNYSHNYSQVDHSQWNAAANQNASYNGGYHQPQYADQATATGPALPLPPPPQQYSHDGGYAQSSASSAGDFSSWSSNAWTVYDQSHTQQPAAPVNSWHEQQAYQPPPPLPPPPMSQQDWGYAAPEQAQHQQQQQWPQHYQQAPYEHHQPVAEQPPPAPASSVLMSNQFDLMQEVLQDSLMQADVTPLDGQLTALDSGGLQAADIGFVLAGQQPSTSHLKDQLMAPVFQQPSTSQQQSSTVPVNLNDLLKLIKDLEQQKEEVEQQKQQLALRQKVQEDLINQLKANGTQQVHSTQINPTAESVQAAAPSSSSQSRVIMPLVSASVTLPTAVQTLHTQKENVSVNNVSVESNNSNKQTDLVVQVGNDTAVSRVVKKVPIVKLQTKVQRPILPMSTAVAAKASSTTVPVVEHSQNKKSPLVTVANTLLAPTEARRSQPPAECATPNAANYNRSTTNNRLAWKTKVIREQGAMACKHKGCQIRYKSTEVLERHSKCHRDDGAGFTCCECSGVQSVHWPSIANHLWRVHKIDMELYQCELCEYRTYSFGTLERIHKKTHSDVKSYICDICQKGFKNQKQLMNHKHRHSAKESKDAAKMSQLSSGESSSSDTNGKQVFGCEICGRTFHDTQAARALRALRVHQNQVHKKLRPFVCSQCGHAAASRSALRTHVRGHTGEKPHQCDQCEYRTSDHNSLRRHRMRHSGERPYKCPFCSYACIQSSTYKQHLRNKHPADSEGTLMFTCNDCGFKSVSNEIYKLHLSDHKVILLADEKRAATMAMARNELPPRSDQESSARSSSSGSPATPSAFDPGSPVMPVLLARGILGQDLADADSQNNGSNHLNTLSSNDVDETPSGSYFC